MRASATDDEKTSQSRMAGNVQERELNEFSIFILRFPHPLCRAWNVLNISRQADDKSIEKFIHIAASLLNFYRRLLVIPESILVPSISDV